jgi:hypothetical protein
MFAGLELVITLIGLASVIWLVRPIRAWRPCSLHCSARSG